MSIDEIEYVHNKRGIIVLHRRQTDRQHNDTVYGFKIGDHTRSADANQRISWIRGLGEIFNLRDIDNVPGIYSRVPASVSFAPDAGAMYMKNKSGVVMKLPDVGTARSSSAFKVMLK